MKKNFSTLLFYFAVTFVFSQQCGYHNYFVFAVNINTKAIKGNFSNLKIYLVDEQEKPYLENVSYFQDGQWKNRYDTLFFWENELEKNEAGKSPLFRQKFYHLGDCHVVVFHLDKVKLKDPITHPIYRIKIEKEKNNLNDFSEGSQIFHLPIQKAIRICGNEITDASALTKPITTIDGKKFKPILINLDNPEETKAVDVERKDELQYVVRFEYRTMQGIDEGFDQYLLTEAKIYDNNTAKLQQEIYIPSISKSISKESKNIVKFIDFYERGIQEAKDFSVLIESWRDLENKVSREKNNFYIFNLKTKKYELDTSLSNYNDVFYYQPLKKMRRYDYETTEKSRTVYTFQLENKKWVLIDKNETLFRADPPKIKYSAKSCIFFRENFHYLPLKAMIGNNTKILVKDTFWLYNACEDTVFISKVESPSRDFFKINQTLLPKQNTPLVFNGTLEANSYDFTTSHFNCKLTLNENFPIVFEIIVPTISNNAMVYYRSDSTILYAVANRENSRFANSVFTYLNGTLRARGIVQDKDTSLKVGNWMFFKENSTIYDPGFIYDILYSKSISLCAFDEKLGYLHNRFKVKIFEKGIWKNPVTESIDNSVRFFITEKTDSILAYTDSTRYSFAINYKKTPNEIRKEIYLLDPKEKSLKIGHYEMPFNLIKDQYTIVLKYNFPNPKNHTTFELVDSCFTVLKKQYPQILLLNVSKNQKGINLINLSAEEKSKILMQLNKDTCIAFVCQLFTTTPKGAIRYCNNKIYTEIDINDPEDFKRKARKMGFVDVSIDISGNRFWITHKNKLIDEEFFNDYKKLTQHPLVLSASPNMYSEPELENKLGH